MFTKKPLGPVTCASCEKNIINLEGRMAEYIPWKRLPFKEPNERISKVIYHNLIIAQYGPGFSRILSMLRPERSVDGMSQVEIAQHIKRNSMNVSIDEANESLQGSPPQYQYYNVSGTTSPQHIGTAYTHHHRHINQQQALETVLPRTVSQQQQQNSPLPNTFGAKTTANFFRNKKESGSMF